MELLAMKVKKIVHICEGSHEGTHKHAWLILRSACCWAYDTEFLVDSHSARST